MMMKTVAIGVAIAVTGVLLGGCKTKTASPRSPRTDAEILAQKLDGTNALIIHVLGAGTGSMSTDAPGGFACSYFEEESSYSQLCWSFVPTSLTSVSVTASAAPHSNFRGWYAGPCRGQDGSSTSCDVAMNGDRVLGVAFSPVPPPNPLLASSFALSVHVLGGGSGAVVSQGATLGCTSFDEGSSYRHLCSAEVANATPGTSVALTATPSPGSSFGGWGASCSGQGACAVVMSKNTSVTAWFLKGCAAAADGTPCSDGNACTQGDTCQSGACLGGTSISCSASADQCHVGGTCDPATGSCTNPAKPDGTTCDDADACTQGDSCQAGSCVSGSPVVCAALDQCHQAGSCDPANGLCSNPIIGDGSACDDGSACTQTDTCQAGTCTGSSPVTCSALDQCHAAGVCDPSSGVCSNPMRSDGVACNDGDLCTQIDTCQSGACTGASPVVCVGLDQCHLAGTCDPATGSCSDPIKPNGTACDDASACTQSDSCQAGTCTGFDPITCAALDQCHVAGTCNPATGVCTDPIQANGIACDDGNGCTQSDSCQAGSCTAGTPVVCAALDQCHLAGSCDPSTGSCSNPVKADGIACDDGTACTQSDSCQGGTCTGASPVICTASDQCHDVGTCNAVTGTCSDPAKADGASCSSGTLCTVDSCISGTCVVGGPVVCTAADACHSAGTCDPGTGLCSNPVAPDGVTCDDANACTLTDLCVSGTCAGSNPIVCSASDQCHIVGVCDPASGTCSNPPATDGTLCDDGNVCTQPDSCQAGACAGTTLFVDDAAKLCIPVGQTLSVAGDRCYPSRVQVDGTLFVTPFDGTTGGVLTLRSPTIAVGAAGQIVADNSGPQGGVAGSAKGSGGGQGSGASVGCGGGPGSVAQGGSGAGYGGVGGTPQTNPPNTYTSPCARCDNPTNTYCYGAAGGATGTSAGSDFDMGSSGGAGGNGSACTAAGGRGGAAGGAIALLGATVQLDGTVSADGESPPQDTSSCGYHPGGGGGSGGAVVVRADALSGAGHLRARGGAGGYSPGLGNNWGWAGGGGSGGRVKVFATNLSYSGTLDVAGGQGGGACGGASCFTGRAGASGSTVVSGTIPGIWTSLSCP